MRLHEITNPNDYILPDTEEMDIYLEIETYLHGNSQSRPKKKQEIKKLAPMHTQSEYQINPR